MTASTKLGVHLTGFNGTLLLLWAALIVTFVFIRISTRMIRAQVRWWPGNITPGGLHVHHIVFGLIMVLIAGFAAFTPLGRDYLWRDGFAVLFGIGAALVLDEFALVLHLRDVYWTEEGRASIDAVVLGVAITGLLVSGLTPFNLNSLSTSTEALLVTAIWLVINVAFVVITLLKGKTWTGLLGIFVPGLAMIGAIRLARPGSPWGRRYPGGSRRLDRARHREVKRARRTALRYRLVELVSGSPNAPADPAVANDKGAATRGAAAGDRPRRAGPIRDHHQGRRR